MLVITGISIWIRSGTLLGEATVSLSFLPPFSATVSSRRKGFVLGADSFLVEYAPFWKGYIWGNNHEVTKVVSFEKKNAEKYGGLPLLLKNLARTVFSIAGKKT